MLGNGLQRGVPKAGDEFGDEAGIGGFTAFATARDGGEERAIGFEQELAIGHPSGCFLHRGRIFKCEDSGK